ncbi:hypothetical protein Pint_23904 [Pistacia integerrima]|uniref:Uncharacterized protein n=1 Tax=Pistacia integerrima TaxID=434235 RepID=A0ACC0YN13_9ROSI|nr:hypothetical protein Pint_23904 [Pistacia integerrima]
MQNKNICLLKAAAKEALGKKLLHEPQPQASISERKKLIPSCCTNSNPGSFKFNSKVASQIEEINTRLQDIATQKEQLVLKSNSGGRSKIVRQRLQETSLVSEAKVYDREKDKETLVELLLSHDSSANGED